MNNIESEQFSRLCDDIHRIANQIAPEDQDNTVNAMMGGLIQGAALALEATLDDGALDQFRRAHALRELVERWKEVADEYYRRQVELNAKSNVTKNGR